MEFRAISLTISNFTRAVCTGLTVANMAPTWGSWGWWHSVRLFNFKYCVSHPDSCVCMVYVKRSATTTVGFSTCTITVNILYRGFSHFCLDFKYIYYMSLNMMTADLDFLLRIYNHKWVSHFFLFLRIYCIYIFGQKAKLEFH